MLTLIYLYRNQSTSKFLQFIKDLHKRRGNGLSSRTTVDPSNINPTPSLGTDDTQCGLTPRHGLLSPMGSKHTGAGDNGDTFLSSAGDGSCDDVERLIASGFVLIFRLIYIYFIIF